VEDKKKNNEEDIKVEEAIKKKCWGS